MPLEVAKSDGSVELYLHTKVLGTFSNALALVDESNVFAAGQFAEAVTFYVHQGNTGRAVKSEEIHLLVQSVLNATGYPEAARALNGYHLDRKLKRKRIEVIENGEGDPTGLGLTKWRWSKSRIVDDLVERHGLDRDVARVVASAVEEKVLSLGMMRIPGSLIRELVLADRDAMLLAHEQLQTAAG